MEVVIIMGLFDKFKKKEDVQQIKTDEQRELENIVQQNHAIFDNAFLGKRATDKEIVQAEQQLGVKIPAPFVWFLKEFGSVAIGLISLATLKTEKHNLLKKLLIREKMGCRKTSWLLKIVMNFIIAWILLMGRLLHGVNMIMTV